MHGAYYENTAKMCVPEESLQTRLVQMSSLQHESKKHFFMFFLLCTAVSFFKRCQKFPQCSQFKFQSMSGQFTSFHVINGLFGAIRVVRSASTAVIADDVAAGVPLARMFAVSREAAQH